MGQTSLPVGQKDSNCVIAAHRGYRGIPYFRDIEQLKTGDQVIIRNPWERLDYRVTKIKVIDPYDMDKILIQKGKDMVTLITCHPYRGHGRYRYVVYCMRNHGQKIRKQKEEIQIHGSSRKEIEEEKWIRYAGIGLLIMTGFKGAGGLELLHRIMEQTIEPVSHGYLVTEEEDPGDSEEGTLEKENAEVPGAQSVVASVADDAEPAGSTAKDLQE